MVSRSEAAAILGRLGGQSRSDRKVAAARANALKGSKAAAARQNGQKGGWPKGKKRKPVDAAQRQYVEEVIAPLMVTLAKGKKRKVKR